MADEKTASETTSAPEEPAKKRFKLWHKVVAGVVGFIVLIIIVAAVATSGAANVSDKFVNAMLTNDATSAYQLFSSEAMKQVPEDQFKLVVGQMSEVLEDTAKQTSKQVSADSDSGTSGSVMYEIKGSDGTYTMTVNLVKEGGEWKVLNFDNSLKE